MGHFDVCYTCETCGEKFTLTYGVKAVCPKCESEDCRDFMEDWEWWGDDDME